jgi:YggT family protein
MGEAALMIRLLATLFIWIIIASALLSYVLSPYHPVRMALDRILEPLLNPIRRVVPPAGMVDLSPLVLIVLIELVSRILVSVLTQ